MSDEGHKPEEDRLQDREDGGDDEVSKIGFNYQLPLAIDFSRLTHEY